MKKEQLAEYLVKAPLKELLAVLEQVTDLVEANQVGKHLEREKKKGVDYLKAARSILQPLGEGVYDKKWTRNHNMDSTQDEA